MFIMVGMFRLDKSPISLSFVALPSEIKDFSNSKEMLKSSSLVLLTHPPTPETPDTWGINYGKPILVRRRTYGL